MVKDIKRVESRNKILDIAEKYFAENGITDTDIAEICRQAGLTRSAFYYHFPTKQQFLLELLDKWVLNMAGHLSMANFQPADCRAIFYGIIDKMQPVFENAGKQLPIFLELYIKAVNDPVLKKYVSASYNSFFDFYRGALEEKVINKSMTADKAEDVAKILIALTFGFLIQGIVNPGSTDWTKLAKKSVDLLLK
jgi:AcrR family transcriptional regulator